MSVAHTIRLREPWDVHPLADGWTEYRRRFGQPRQRDPAETVWLVCTALPAGATVALNGESIPPACDVTARLQPRNEVAIASDGLIGEVRLEIRTPD